MSLSLFVLSTEREVPRDRDPGWRAEYEAWTYSVPMDSGRGPFRFVQDKKRAWVPSLSDLLFFSGHQALSPSRGGTLAFADSHSSPSHFDLLWHGADDLGALTEIVRVHGGEAFAARSYCSRLHLVLCRSRGVESPAEVAWVSFSLRRPRERPRARWARERLRSWFAASTALHPDLGAIEQALDAETLDELSLLKALAGDSVQAVLGPATDATGAYRDFYAFADWIMGGSAIAPAARKRLDALVRGDEPLAKKPPKPAARARALWGPFASLERRFGPPPAALSEVRRAASSRYSKIADDGLVVGRDKKGFGESASLARLLACYPEPTSRDPVSLALAARDAEAWNGHAFVRALETLSGAAAEAGFTLAVFPSELRGKFYSAFGLEGTDKLPSATPPWAAEAFIDLPGVLKADPVEALGAWFKREKASGVVLRAGADGQTALTSHGSGGPQPKDAEALSRAARALWPRGAILALGLPDLLAPLPLDASEIEVEGPRLKPPSPSLAARVREIFSALDPPKPLCRPEELLGEHPQRVVWIGLDQLDDHQLRAPPEEGPIFALRVEVPGGDPAYLAELASSLRGRSCWVEGSAAHAWLPALQGWIDSRDLACSLADAPAGTTVALEHHAPRPEHWVLTD